MIPTHQIKDSMYQPLQLLVQLTHRDRLLLETRAILKALHANLDGMEDNPLDWAEAGIDEYFTGEEYQKRSKVISVITEISENLIAQITEAMGE